MEIASNGKTTTVFLGVIANTFQSCILWDSGMFAFGFQPCPPSPVINVSSFLPGKNKGIASVGVEL